jgi:hypothetical protein
MTIHYLYNFSLVYAKVKLIHSSLSKVWNGGQIKLNLTMRASIAMQENSQILLILRNLHFTQSEDLIV